LVQVDIVDAVRSAMCRNLGELSLSPQELLAQTITALLDRTGLDPADIDDVVVGCPYPAGEDGQTVGRAAWLAAGLPSHIPTTSINGSGQQALLLAARQARARSCQVTLVAGVDTADHAQRGPKSSVRRAWNRTRPAERCLQPYAAAELVADKWGLNRQQLDAYAVRSHHRAAQVADAGEFGAEIVPISVPGNGRSGARLITRDDTIDSKTDAEKLNALTAILDEHPDEAHDTCVARSITTGNSAQPANGAAAMLITTPTSTHRLLRTARARLRSFAVAADEPAAMLAAPKRATERALADAKIKLNQIDHVEVDEAFAAIPLAWLAEFRVRPDIFNPRGGALAFGKTPSCGAVRQMTTMLNALEATGGRFGLQTVCGDAGIAAAVVLERF
jgi:acetyl-CoA acyltransferase